jgi:hypothetical protein
MAARGTAAAVVVVATVVVGVVVFVVASWHPSRRCASQRRLASPDIISLIGADHQLIIFVIRVLAIRKPHHSPRCADHATPAHVGAKVLAQTR